MNTADKIAELERELARLPQGSIVKKSIKGKEYFYHRINKNNVRKETYVDFSRVDDLNAQIEKIARITNEFIQKSNGIIVTEYCKKEDTWKKYKDVSISLDKSFLDDLASKEIIESKIQSSIKEKKLEKDVNCMVEVYNLGSTYWTNLLAEGMKRHILSPTEMDLLKLAVAYADGKKFPSDKQAKLIWKIREKLDQAGVLI